MRGVDLFGFAVAGTQLKHCARNFVLAISRQPADGCECAFKELSHTRILCAGTAP